MIAGHIQGLPVEELAGVLLAGGLAGVSVAVRVWRARLSGRRHRPSVD